MMRQKIGTLFGIGVGPGDPDLITQKAIKTIARCDVIGYHQSASQNSHALRIAQQWLQPCQQLLALTYPVTTEIASSSKAYKSAMATFYQTITHNIAAHLESGQNVGILAEGDPLFYSSFMYIFDNLKAKYDCEIIPGVSSIFAAAAALKQPICYRNQTFSVLSGVAEEGVLSDGLAHGDACIIMKIGRHLSKIKRVLAKHGLLERALYIERASMLEEKIIPIAAISEDKAPYFSIILVPGQSPWEDSL